MLNLKIEGQPKESDIKEVVFAFATDDAGDIRIRANGIFVAYVGKDDGVLNLISLTEHSRSKSGLPFNNNGYWKIE